ncbi:MAG: FtsX-like permease family protein [Calditrichaeota bacterium]|nr:FtsX-like permease family protein [Calditrichota bacterium]
MAVRIRPQNVPETVAYIEKTWASFIPYKPFEYFFLDDNYDALYRAEQRTGQLFTRFSLLAIFIACLGLFGLASFTTEQRTREIGIRKVLGASVPAIIFKLSREFTRWVLLANLIAWPLAWLAMRAWLEDFAYRITIGPAPFIAAGLIALVIALLTISYQAIKAALTNPADALRYE